jgi:hypothetical protein
VHSENGKPYRIGVVSDTHGLVRPQTLAVLAGARLILHAGDVGGMEVLGALRQVAPVFAVRGNMDRGPWAASLPESQVVEAAGLLFYVLHDQAQLDLDPASAGFAAVISGHSHRPSIKTQRGVVLFNPGSAGPKRFGLPVTVGLIEVDDQGLSARIVEIEV